MYSASLFTDMFSILLLLVLLLASLLVLTITALKKCRQFKIGDKVPNLRETDKKASGPSGGVIKWNTPRFHNELVFNDNPCIVFKDEDNNPHKPNHYMTPRCKEKADKLAELVMKQWKGIKLRITAAWAEESGHTNNSLHYSGRALDITTSDRDLKKYGKLASLAVKGGFDWVFYEDKLHVHVSCKDEK